MLLVLLKIQLPVGSLCHIWWENRMLIECNVLHYDKFLISALCGGLQKAEIGYTNLYMGLA